MVLPRPSEPDPSPHEELTHAQEGADLPDYPGLTGPGVPLATPLPIARARTLPAQLGRYRIVRLLGSGGMTSVYLAHDTELDRQVALKVPHIDPHLGPQLLERFARESRAAATLQHPHICQVYDVGRIDGVPFLTMAYIEGQPLSQRIEPGQPWPEREAVLLVRTVALALADAHGRGVIHRDLKPSNIMIDPRGQPILMDFGLARRLDRDEQLTQLGAILGTPAYMPPEQVLGDVEAMGPASDIYSLGVILFQLLTGQLPFQGGTALLLASIVSQDPPRLRSLQPELGPALEAICLKAMARNLGQRYASMLALAETLDSNLGSAVREEQPAAAVTETKPALSADMARTVLDLLRQWGWSVGLRKLRFKVYGQRKRGSWQLLFDWLGGEENGCVEALAGQRSEAWFNALEGWRLAGQALGALRERDYRRAHRLLLQAETAADAGDTTFRANLLHTRASVRAHEGKSALALRDLHQALMLFGKDHFMTGRVLDTLGMVYAGKGNFHLALGFYEQALRAKEQRQDEDGLALTHGQLGRLFLSWGRLDETEEHFRTDLRLAEKQPDPRTESQMYDHLGQVALARAEREAAANRRAGLRRHAGEAAGWLDSSIRLAEESRSVLAEPFARKDRALVFLLEGQLAEAEEQAAQAEALFRGADFAEGLALVNHVWGVLRRLQGRCDESMRRLKTALTYFDSTEERARAVLTLWELARTQRDAGASGADPAGLPPRRPHVARAFEEALVRAEQLRRDTLVEQIEAELREVDHEVYYRHLYRRVRGPGESRDETAHLGSGESDQATVLLLSLQGLSEEPGPASPGRQPGEPETVLQTFNQVLADLEEVLERYRVQVLTYHGDGFLAILRQHRHAERSVQAALDLVAAVAELNLPRQVFGQPELQVCIALGSGTVFLGNVGTYRKMDFTAVGPAVSQASLLLSAAEPGKPCLSAATHASLSELYVYAETGPRTLTGPDGNLLSLWDVLGRRE